MKKPLLNIRLPAENSENLFGESSLLDALAEGGGRGRKAKVKKEEEAAFPRMSVEFSVEEIDPQELEELDAMETLYYEPGRESGELPSLRGCTTEGLEEGTLPTLPSASFFPLEEEAAQDSPFEEAVLPIPVLEKKRRRVRSVKGGAKEHRFYDWSVERGLESVLLVRDVPTGWRAIRWSEGADREKLAEDRFAGLLRECEASMKAQGGRKNQFTTIFIMEERAWLMVRDEDLLTLTASSVTDLGVTLSKARMFLEG